MDDSEITLNRQIGVEAIRPGCYRSVVNPTRMGKLSSTAFGGNLLAIAVNSTYQTVSHLHHLYSICGHFLRPATTDRRLICEVQNLRDTRSFQTRVVRVSQEADDGSMRVCLVGSADFHVEEPASMVTYTVAPQPSASPTLASVDLQYPLPHEYGLYKYIEKFTDVRPIFLQEGDTDRTPESAPSVLSSERFQVRGPLKSEAEELSALAFYMDRGLAYIPANHSGYELIDASACATLDFALRIFRPEITLKNWHVSEQRTAVANKARAFSEGRVWDENGILVASMTQQTMLRPKPGFIPRI
jgi:acyl-CoA thioesterase II